MFSFIKKAVSDLFVASPAEATPSLIWKYPDRSIPNGAKVTVRADEVAVFVREGRIVGHLMPGTFLMATENIPFLNDLLIAKFTGDNHYITELFFVRMTESIHSTSLRRIGSFQDAGTRLMVELGFEAQFSVRVSDPIRLLLQLAGLRDDASAKVSQFLDARVTSLLSACVGQLVEQYSVAQLLSNQFSEQIGQFAIQKATETFPADGLHLGRFLELQLRADDASRAALHAYSSKEASLRLQSQEVELASRPGYVNMQLAQGQRALLEGMARAAPNTPALGMMGIGMVGGMMPMPRPIDMGVAPSSQRPAPALARMTGPQRYYVRTPRGVEGPFPAKQLVVRALAAGATLEDAQVRAEGEAEWTSAAEVDEVASEFARHDRPAPRSSRGSRSTAIDAFERSFAVGTLDKIVTPDELAMLVQLALAAGLADSAQAAEEHIRMRARAVGASCPPDPRALPPSRGPAAGGTRSLDDEPPLPSSEDEPPPLPTLERYTYSDGKTREPGLTLREIADRVAAAPSGTHLVWKKGMPEWVSAQDVLSREA